MKYRADFVTNSSSSSFVIALKNGATLEDIQNALAKRKDDIMKEVAVYGIEEGPDAMLVLSKFIMEKAKRGFNVENWKISAFESHSENGDACSIFYRVGLSIDTDILKIH